MLTQLTTWLRLAQLLSDRAALMWDLGAEGRGYMKTERGALQVLQHSRVSHLAADIHDASLPGRHEHQALRQRQNAFGCWHSSVSDKTPTLRRPSPMNSSPTHVLLRQS